jgi:hypothetical protein
LGAGNQGSLANISIDTWLSPHKQKIVTAWTRQRLHYGNTVTSRTESLHSSLKTVLRHSMGDLKDVVDAFSAAQRAAV